MGSWNVRRVRRTKQLNHFVKAFGGGAKGKAAVAGAITRHRALFKKGSKAYAFWRASMTFRNGKFITTNTSANRKQQAPLIHKGAGFPTIDRQNVNLKVGAKLKPKGKQQTRKADIVIYNGTTKGLTAKVMSGNLKLDTKKAYKAIMKGTRSEGNKGYLIRNEKARTRSIRSKKAAAARKTRLANERKAMEAKKKPAKKAPAKPRNRKK